MKRVKCQLAVYAFHPADTAAAPGKFERAYGFERHTHTAFDFRAEGVRPYFEWCSGCERF